MHQHPLQQFLLELQSKRQRLHRLAQDFLPEQAVSEYFRQEADWDLWCSNHSSTELRQTIPRTLFPNHSGAPAQLFPEEYSFSRHSGSFSTQYYRPKDIETPPSYRRTQQLSYAHMPVSNNTSSPRPSTHAQPPFPTISTSQNSHLHPLLKSIDPTNELTEQSAADSPVFPEISETKEQQPVSSSKPQSDTQTQSETTQFFEEVTQANRVESVPYRPPVSTSVEEEAFIVEHADQSIKNSAENTPAQAKDIDLPVSQAPLNPLIEQSENQSNSLSHDEPTKQELVQESSPKENSKPEKSPAPPLSSKSTESSLSVAIKPATPAGPKKNHGRRRQRFSQQSSQIFENFFDEQKPIDSPSLSKHHPEVHSSSGLNLNNPIDEDSLEEPNRQLISDSFTRSEEILAEHNQPPPDPSYIKQRASEIQNALEENPYQVELWQERSILFEQSKAWPRAISDLLRVIMMLSKSGDDKALLAHKKRLSLLYVKANVRHPHHGLEHLFKKDKQRRIKSEPAQPHSSNADRSSQTQVQ